MTGEARIRMAKMGYDPGFRGAPAEAPDQRSIGDPLAIAILEGRYLEGDTVKVDVEDRQTTRRSFSFNPRTDRCEFRLTFFGNANPSRESAVPATIVVGTQWGDEGKGRFTDLLAKEMSMVVRYQAAITRVIRWLLTVRHSPCNLFRAESCTTTSLRSLATVLWSIPVSSSLRLTCLPGEASIVQG